MAFGRLASLLVDIVINTRRFQSQLGYAEKKTQDAANNMRRSLTTIGLAASGILIVKKAFDLTISAIEGSILAFANLEKQIINIQKVAKFENFNEFAKGFIELGLKLKGISFAELGEIGGDLARLGVRGGPQGFLDFLEVAAKFKQATGDIDLRQAGEGLGKILQNFGKELNASEALRMASSINNLADETAVTSSEILNLTQKLSGFADAIGLSAQETLGFVTTVKQTGISSTVVASTFTRLFALLETQPIKVAEALGKSGQAVNDFLTSIRTTPAAAVKEFAEILSKMPIDEASKTLKYLELSTSQNMNAILNLMNRIQDWDRIQRLASEGAGDVSKLLDKSALSAATADAKIEHLKNTWEAFKSSFASGGSIFGDVLGNLDNFLTNINNNASRLHKILSNIAIILDFIGYTNPFVGPIKLIENVLVREATAESSSKENNDEKAFQARQKYTLDEQLKGIQKQDKLADNEIRMVKEQAANQAAFKGGVGLFEEPKFEQTVRERFERLAKEQKKKFDEAAGGTVEIHKQIDLIKERRILEEIGVHQQIEFNKQFEEEIKAGIAHLNALESSRLGIIGFLTPGSSSISSVLNRALQVDKLISDMPLDMKLNANLNLKDLLFKSALSEQESPKIRGLTEAYKEAITDLGQDSIDKETLEAIKQLVDVQIENKELAKQTVDAIKQIEVGVK